MRKSGSIKKNWLRKGKRGNFHLALLLQENDVTATTLTPPGCPPIEGLLTPPHGVWGFPGSLPEEHSWPRRAWPLRWLIWPHSHQLGCKSGTSYVILESPCLFVRLRVQQEFSGIFVRISLFCSCLGSLILKAHQQKFPGGPKTSSLLYLEMWYRNRTSEIVQCFKGGSEYYINILVSFWKT